jgi:broad specificity phosphatase PhoE
MELLLLRHAQPEWSRDGFSQVDPGLTATGNKQAELTAERLAPERFDELLVSTATRSQETAAPIRASHDTTPTEDRAWLHEIRMPLSWEGTPAEEVDRAFAEARHRPREVWWEGMPGGESFRDFHARVVIGLDAELAEVDVYRDDDSGLWEVPRDAPRLLMVAHAGTNSVILGHLLGLEPQPWEWERFASDHASLTLLRSTRIGGGHIFSLQSFSDVSHLPPDLVTA